MRGVVLSKLREHGVEPIFMDLEEVLPLMRTLGESSSSTCGVACKHTLWVLD